MLTRAGSQPPSFDERRFANDLVPDMPAAAELAVIREEADMVDRLGRVMADDVVGLHGG
jgi:hypothetical protein